MFGHQETFVPLLLNNRKGNMLQMLPATGDGFVTLQYEVPSRGMNGVKSKLLSATRGTDRSGRIERSKGASNACADVCVIAIMASGRLGGDELRLPRLQALCRRFRTA